MKIKTIPYTSEELNKMFIYQDGKLYRQTGRRGTYSHSWAGHIRFDGYYYLKINGVNYKTHRVIYKMFHPDMDESLIIDHIDGNQSNNSIENLRLTTQSDNMKNKRGYSNNKSNYTGVYWRNDSNKWRVYIADNGKRVNLGCYSDINEAVMVRNQAIKDYEYSETHGVNYDGN